MGDGRECIFGKKLVAANHDKHSWAKREYVEAVDFESQHLIVDVVPIENAYIFQLLLNSKDITPQKVTPMHLAPEAAVEMVKANMGVTVLAQWAAGKYVRNDPLSTVRLTLEGIHRRWYIATRNETLPRYLKSFIEQLKSQSNLKLGTASAQ